MNRKENRIVKKSFRFTRNEWNLIETKCEKIGVTPSQYFQKVAIIGKVVKQDCLKEKERYLYQIANVSDDINTIIRHLNSRRQLDFLALKILFKIEKKLNKDWLI